jgi:UDP:flavonoid glycosyltransferase YjiC (YdhE family)
MTTIRLLFVGSRGDLQPDLAILLELQRRGHSVQLIGSINFDAMTMAISMGATADNPSFRQRAREQQQMLAGEDKVANVVAEIDPSLIKDGIKEGGGQRLCKPASVANIQDERNV